MKEARHRHPNIPIPHLCKCGPVANPVVVHAVDHHGEVLAFVAEDYFEVGEFGEEAGGAEADDVEADVDVSAPGGGS